MRQRRKFSAEFKAKFKAKVVLEILSDTKSAAEFCQEHSLNPDLLLAGRQSLEIEILHLP